MRMTRRHLGGLLIAPFFVAATPVFAQESAPAGRVVRQTGPVTVVRDDTPSPLLLGAPVFSADLIVTGSDAQLAIEFVDGSMVVVSAGCQMRIDDYVADRDGYRWSAVVSLLVGALRAAVQPVGSGGFQVRTETAVASARSTEWVVVAEPGTTGVFVIEGSVAVAGAAGSSPVLLEPGFGTDVAAGEAPTAPKRWGAERVQRTLARVRLP